MTTIRLSMRAAIAAALLAVSGTASHAQGTALVPPGDPAYVDLDRLIGLGLVDSVIVGQRPYSERELGRLLDIARRRIASSARDSTEDAIAAAAVRRLEARLGQEGAAPPALSLFQEGTIVATSTDAQRRPFLVRNGGGAETTIDPLDARRLGTTAVRGRTLALEVAQRAEPTGWLALNARERFEVRHAVDDGASSQHAELLLGGARARYRNAALSVGREQFTWAQRAGDGLALASDAPALDQVSLASDRPFQLPGFLRGLGPASAMLLAADLGASVSHSHTKFVVYKVSVTPSSALELGANFEKRFGGAGARPSSIGNRLIDFLPFIDIFRRHNYYDTTRTLEVESDKTVGADARLTLRRLGGVVIAGEWLVDDFDVSRLSALFTNDASQSIAIMVPRVGSAAVSLELSAKHTGVYAYTHAQLTNGMTTRGRLLGDELGPDTKSFGAVLRWQPSPALQLSFDGRTTTYSDAVYFGSDNAAGDWVVYKTSSNPNELRDRLLVSATWRGAGRMDAWARAGGERIRNARYFGDRAPYVAEVGIRVRE